MNGRERFVRMLGFEPVERGFNHELGLWPQALDRWHTEGLPEDVIIGDWLQGCEYLQIERVGYVPVRVLEMYPPFEVEVLEEDERYRVTRWADGHVSRALKEGEVRGGRTSMDTYIAFPVTDRDSFHAIQKRYDALSPARYPEWWDDTVRCLAGRDYPLALTHNGCFGLYSFLRRLMGTEAACTVFYDDPVLAEEMLDWMTDHLLTVLERALATVQVDYFNYFEDYCYNAGPLVGPNIFAKFLMKRYRRINDHLRAHGVRHIMLDSDGNTELLMPLMIEAGINVHWPLERAANMDPLAIRAKYGHDLALIGGIDKRALAQGRKAIDAELYRHVPQLLEDGGYIPTVDHTVPHDVSYDDFQYYMEVKRRLLGL